MEEKGRAIIQACKNETSKDPYLIFYNIAQEDFINMHGPEHHILDGASLLTAFYNAGGQVDLDQGLETILERGLEMPGASCGLWGVCCSVTSIGAALSIIENTGPLSDDGSWGDHMKATSEAIAKQGELNGPRCCKRNAYVALETVIPYIKDRFGVELDQSEIICDFSKQNPQCLGKKCPYHKANHLA